MEDQDIQKVKIWSCRKWLHHGFSHLFYCKKLALFTKYLVLIITSLTYMQNVKYSKFWSVWLEHFIKHTNLLTCYVECNISKIKHCALKLKRAREIHTSSFLHPRCKFGKSECYKMGNHYHYYYYHYQLLARCSTYISLGGESTWHHSAKVFGIIFLIRYMKIYTIMKLC